MKNKKKAKIISKILHNSKFFHLFNNLIAKNYI